jgi:hypothetical protein
MALAIKVLGNGTIGGTTSNQLLNASGYTNNAVPGEKAVIIKNIRFVNTHATTTRTVTVKYVAGGTAARTVSPVGLTLAPKNLVILDEELILVAGDKLQADFGETTSGNVVDFVVAGIERDA